jgi:hypothetical protein
MNDITVSSIESSIKKVDRSMMSCFNENSDLKNMPAILIQN